MMRSTTLKGVALAGFIFSHTTQASVDLVKIDKSQNKMYLMEKGKVIKSYHIALSSSPKGHKQQEGDKKTPEGRYILDYKKEDSAFYRAMHISYPNKKDLAKAKAKGVSAGGFIMIHGQKNKTKTQAAFNQRFNWTNGCIALTNSEMDEFMLLIDEGTKIDIQW